MKNQFVQHLAAAAAHHVELGKVSKKLEEAHKKIAAHLGEGTEGDAHRDIAECHGEARKLHALHAERYINLCRALDGDTIPTPAEFRDRGGDGEPLDGPKKAFNPWGNRNPSEVIPSGVHSGAGLQMVLRTGMSSPAADDGGSSLDRFAHPSR